MSEKLDAVVQAEPVTESIPSLDVPLKPRCTRSDYRRLLLSNTPLLDVRAPVEFAKGAFPCSVNAPLMTDEERHLIGIRYMEAGQQKAIELGAELVTTELREYRVAQWLAFARQYPGGALYCFRGGLRSRITQQWMAEAGVSLPLIEGGYKAMRSFLINSLQSLCQSLSFTLIGGRTGNGKTLLLRQLGQSVDLEFLANHRGSSFGGMVLDQPSNIDFENAVCIALMRLEEAGASNVFMEDEARLIGRVCLPDTLRGAMQSAPIVILECDMATRIQHCYGDYVSDLLARYTQTHGAEKGFAEYREHHLNSLLRIKKRFGTENYNTGLQLLNRALNDHEEHNDTRAYTDFIEMLLRDYYDPMYDYQLGTKQHRVVFKGSCSDILDWLDAA